MTSQVAGFVVELFSRVFDVYALILLPKRKCLMGPISLGYISLSLRGLIAKTDLRSYFSKSRFCDTPNIFRWTLLPPIIFCHGAKKSQSYGVFDPCSVKGEILQRECLSSELAGPGSDSTFFSFFIKDILYFKGYLMSFPLPLISLSLSFPSVGPHITIFILACDIAVYPLQCLRHRLSSFC